MNEEFPVTTRSHGLVGFHALLKAKNSTLLRKYCRNYLKKQWKCCFESTTYFACQTDPISTLQPRNECMLFE